MKKGTIILGIFIVLLSLNVMAFGAVFGHPRDKPIELQPGQSIIITNTLQNMVGEKDLIMKATIASGKEIAEFLEDPNYEVPYGQANVKSNIKITAPLNAIEGDQYNIIVNYLADSGEKQEGGTVGLLGALTQNFGVVITGGAAREEVEEIKEEIPRGISEEETAAITEAITIPSVNLGLISFIAVMILIILVVLLHRKKQ